MSGLHADSERPPQTLDEAKTAPPGRAEAGRNDDAQRARRREMARGVDLEMDDEIQARTQAWTRATGGREPWYRPSTPLALFAVIVVGSALMVLLSLL